MAATAPHFDMQIKLLLIGDSGVGKTCALLRYACDTFSPTFITSIGIDFKIKNIEIDGKRIKLQIWDTAGQERFRTITTSYFRGAQGILFFYDVTDKGSFNSIKNWMQQTQVHADCNVNRILCGSKCDINDRRTVSFEQGKQLAHEYGIQFFEVSSKNELNIFNAFGAIARQVKERLYEERKPQAPNRKTSWLALLQPGPPSAELTRKREARKAEEKKMQAMRRKRPPLHNKADVDVCFCCNASFSAMVWAHNCRYTFSRLLLFISRDGSMVLIIALDCVRCALLSVSSQQAMWPCGVP